MKDSGYKSRLKILLYVLCLSGFSNVMEAAEQANKSDISHRIIGGEVADFSRWPSTVALEVGSSLCGGTLIASNWVLTAAHCVFTSDGAALVAADIRVGAGSANITEMLEIMGVSNIIVHDQYVSSNVGSAFDIALLELSTHSKQPIASLYKGADHESGTEVSVAGWGTQNYDPFTGEASNTSRVLREVAVNIVTYEDCNALEVYRGRIFENQICAGVLEGGKDSCAGDSGGPLMVSINGTLSQVGVVSFGAGCAIKDAPGVYTRTSSFISWISQYTTVSTVEAGSGDDGGGGGSVAFGLLALLMSLLLVRHPQIIARVEG